LGEGLGATMSGGRAKRFPLVLADLSRTTAAAPRVKPGEAKTGSGAAQRKLVGFSSVASPHQPRGAAAAGKLRTGSAGATAKAAPGFIAATGVKATGGKTTNSNRASGNAASGNPTNSKAAMFKTTAKTSPLGAHGMPRRAAGPVLAANGTVSLTSERIRQRMVERLMAGGIRNPRVLEAMGSVPRHIFIDAGLASQAYEDAALPIGHHQTISKPSVVARMVELLAAGRPLAKVLEIGTGCGYQAAVLSRVATEVYSIERVRPLFERAKSNLRPLRVPNIRLHYGDGRLGLSAAAPFDAIIVAAAGLDVPQALLDQLEIGGRLVAPVASTDGGNEQILTMVERTGPAQWRTSRLDRVFFVPLKSGVI
jgi:protein-L-isoaspartate(D-aspartate) O-methyltransferase